MAVTQNPTAKDAPAPYAVTRAFYWAGEVQPVDTVLQLSKADAAPLMAANKLMVIELAAAPREPAKTAKTVVLIKKA